MSFYHAIFWCFYDYFLEIILLGRLALVVSPCNFLNILLDTYAKQLAGHFVRIYSKMYLLRVTCELSSCSFLMFLCIFLEIFLLGRLSFVLCPCNFLNILLDTYAKQLAGQIFYRYSMMYLLWVICELIPCPFLLCSVCTECNKFLYLVLQRWFYGISFIKYVCLMTFKKDIFNSQVVYSIIL